MELLCCGAAPKGAGPAKICRTRAEALSALDGAHWDMVLWHFSLGMIPPDLLPEDAGLVLVSGEDSLEFYRWATKIGCRRILTAPEDQALEEAIRREWDFVREQRRNRSYRSLFEKYGDHLKVHLWFDLIVEGQYENLLEPVPYRLLLLYGASPDEESLQPHPPGRADSPTILSGIFQEAVAILALQRPWECVILPANAEKLPERMAKCQAALEQQLGTRRELRLSPPLLPDQLHDFYLQTVREAENSRERSVSALVCGYIQAHLGEKLTRKTISGDLFFSPDYLAKVFLAETGVTMGTYICQTRLERAKDQLLHTGLPVGAIAAGLGYQNFSEFSQWFKKQTGLTPSKYRSSGGP